MQIDDAEYEALKRDAERWIADCAQHRKGYLGIVPYYERSMKSKKQQDSLADAAIAKGTAPESDS